MSVTLARRAIVCGTCGGEPHCPMLAEGVWLSIAGKRDLLCTNCAEARLGRPITEADFNDSHLSAMLRYWIARTRAGALKVGDRVMQIKYLGYNTSLNLYEVSTDERGWHYTATLAEILDWCRAEDAPGCVTDLVGFATLESALTARGHRWWATWEVDTWDINLTDEARGKNIAASEHPDLYTALLAVAVKLL